MLEIGKLGKYGELFVERWDGGSRGAEYGFEDVLPLPSGIWWRTKHSRLSDLYWASGDVTGPE
jgi:hypothetical protein